MTKDIPEITVPTKCYVLDGLTWVPHYTQRGIYVATGGRYRTAQELLRRKAIPTSMMLWERSWK